MKAISMLLIMLCTLQSCHAQKKDQIITTQNKTNMEPIVTKDFEKFDSNRYEKLKAKDKFNTTEFLPDGTYIEMDEGNYGKSYSEIKPNSYFKLSKGFYSNGNIKLKGVSFNWFAFQKGIWYEFDEQGKLIKEIDYDKNYKFTFEDILKFCEKEKIEVKKGPILQSTGFHTTIRREYSETTKKATWTIEHLKTFDIKETIALDGTTGAVLSRRESPFINN
jgi:antitoxin component YwqK of YwqJK toxin-antitoxin module